LLYQVRQRLSSADIIFENKAGEPSSEIEETVQVT
jgi:hypothetical protein